MALGAEGILVSGEVAVATPPMTTKNQHGRRSPSQDSAPNTGKRAQDTIKVANRAKDIGTNKEQTAPVHLFTQHFMEWNVSETDSSLTYNVCY